MLALTGTPGVGKTEVARELKKRGYKVISVREFAEKHGCLYGDVVDLEKLKNFSFDGIIEGHLAHFLARKAIVLRCDPIIIKRRLIDRGWSYEKVMENVEAELLDVILVEALENCDEVHEIDTTNMSVKEVVDAVESILKGASYPYGKVDWLSKYADRLGEVARL